MKLRTAPADGEAVMARLKEVLTSCSRIAGDKNVQVTSEGAAWQRCGGCIDDPLPSQRRTRQRIVLLDHVQHALSLSYIHVPTHPPYPFYW